MTIVDNTIDLMLQEVNILNLSLSITQTTTTTTTTTTTNHHHFPSILISDIIKLIEALIHKVAGKKG